MFIDHIDLENIHISICPTEQYMHSFSAQRPFSRLGYMLCYKTKLNFKNTEIIPNILSDSNRMKLETNRKLESPRICGN